MAVLLGSSQNPVPIEAGVSSAAAPIVSTLSVLLLGELIEHLGLASRTSISSSLHSSCGDACLRASAEQVEVEDASGRFPRYLLVRRRGELRPGHVDNGHHQSRDDAIGRPRVVGGSVTT